MPLKIGKILSILILLLCFYSCKNEVEKNNLFKLVDPAFSKLDFYNELPINVDLNIFNYMYYYNGGGLAVADLNNDGLTDVIFSSNIGPEEVYLNQGGLVFKNITDKINIDGGPNSWTNGVAVVDINMDGLLDVYLSQVGTYRKLNCKNKLFICTGLDSENIPQYEERAAQYGLDFKGFSTQAGFFDYDLDGDLDMYLMNHSLHHNGTFGKRKDFVNTVSDISGDKLFRNDDQKFVDVTLEAGIYSNVIGYGLGLSFGDLNADGYPDIYVGNDFHENDYLYQNNGDGTFTEVLTEQIKHTSKFSMGVDIADINNDTHLDIISLDMLPEDPYILKTSGGEEALDVFNFKLRFGYHYQYAKNALQLNQGNGSFKEIASYANVHATDWSWSPLIFDFNMDGTKDLFVSNGIPRRMNDLDYINFVAEDDMRYKIQFDHVKEDDLSTLEKIPEIKIMNKFYQGSENLKFNDINSQVGNHEVSYSNSAAYADFDLDGDYDVICNNINQVAFLYENKSESKKSVRIILDGAEANKYGLGSKVISYHGDEKLIFNYTSTRGFQSSMINEILIPAEGLDSIKLVWPDNSISLRSYHGEESMTITYKDNLPKNKYVTSSGILVKDKTDILDVEYNHVENGFVEFNREPLIPFSTSAEGPGLAVGDINGDGLDDFFIGSSKRKRNALYMQNSQGGFEMQTLNGEVQDSIYEEVDAVFLDIDGDNDLDLVVATGGNEYRLTSEFTRPLLYKNDDGNLIRDVDAFSNIHNTFSKIASGDFDNDGDIDLFFAGRAVPWSYGVIPESYIMLNDGLGNFSDVTEKWNKELGTIGFVKDAKCIDIDDDQDIDIVLALEWGPILLMENVEGQFQSREIVKRHGWWNSLLIEDFDGDGDLDFFAGNLGENSRLKASKEEPIKMYYNDFDDNGKSEQILSYFLDGREIPFNNMMELQKQIPILKKKYLHAKDFANASMAELLGQEKFQSSKIFYAEEMRNSLYLNDGNGAFAQAELPKEIQYSTYNDSHASDINRDGLIDIILGGNYSYSNVQMGKYDAENGSVLLNRGEGKFEYINMNDSPLKSDVQNIRSIKIAGIDCHIFAQNNGPLKILKINTVQ